MPLAVSAMMCSVAELVLQKCSKLSVVQLEVQNSVAQAASAGPMMESVSVFEKEPAM